MIKKQYSKKKAVCKLTFSLTNEQIGKNGDVRVLGQFNNWNWAQGLILKSKKKHYEASIELPTGASYEFRYLKNGQQWFNDEAADDYVSTPFMSSNSVVVLETQELKAVTEKPAKKVSKKKTAEKPASKQKAAAPKKTTAKAKSIKKVTSKKTLAKKTTAKKADDLKKIEGIGPKIASLLKADGILSFADLSKAKMEQLQAILKAAGPRFKMHQPTTWPEQAQLAADAKWDELASLQEELKGGKRK